MGSLVGMWDWRHWCARTALASLKSFSGSGSRAAARKLVLRLCPAGPFDLALMPVELQIIVAALGRGSSQDAAN